MLIIKTKQDLKNILVVEDVEAIFKQLLITGNLFDDEIYVNIMKYIDKIIYKDGNLIKTRFGTTTLENLSTGCKTAILAIHYYGKDVYTRIDECGENVLKLLYKLSENKNMNVYASVPIPVYDNVDCVIEGKRYTDGYEVYRKLVELNGYN